MKRNTMSGKNILVVDDESAIREMMKVILSNYEVTEASNGCEAIERCNEKNPDLILMDVKMPKMDGIEATKAIMNKYPHTKVVAITAYATDKKKEMLDAGAINVLEKPFKKDQIRGTVEEQFRTTKGNYCS